MMTTNTSKDLSDVLYALALAMPVPDPKTLDEFVRRYPEHAEALTDFVVQLALDAGLEGDEESDEIADGSVSPAVSRAISYFQNVAFELEQSAGTGAADAVANPFLPLSRDQFRDYADKLGANALFVTLLRDRSIDPDSVAQHTEFCRKAADGLNIPVPALIAHLRAPSVVHEQQRFKADQKPAVTTRITFEEAVRNSGLTPEQQRRLLES